MVSVDLECPEGDSWPAKPYQCNLIPEVFYSKHPPIFANTEILFSDLGKTMQ